MGVTLGVYGATDATGWTVITESVDTVKYYVSSSGGSDSNNGLSIGAPFLTLNKAITVLNGLTNNIPYWILLKAGDTWTDEAFGQIKKSGRSATEPILISTYGTGARPLIKSAPGVNAMNSAGIGGGENGGDYFAVIGLEFYSYKRDPANPSYVGAPVSDSCLVFQGLTRQNWILFEDCKITYYQVGLSFQPYGVGQQVGGVTVRRCVIRYCHGSTGHAQGMYTSDIDSFTVEENVFDNNGWLSGITGSEANIFNHNCYLNSNNSPYPNTWGPIKVRGNILARASSHGAKIQQGGIVEDNLFTNNPIACIAGAFSTGQNTCRYNVVINGGSIAGSARSYGIDCLNTNTTGNTWYASGGTLLVEWNVLLNAQSQTGFGVRLFTNVTAVTVRNNAIYHYGTTAITDVSGSGSANTVGTNEIDLGTYSDVTRTVASYYLSIGGTASETDFYDACALQSKASWDKKLTAQYANDYLRGGTGRRKMMTIRTGS